MKPVGIFGGTFDPIHYGHLRLALELYEALGLQELRLIPLHTPPHRRVPVATPQQRFAMVELAVTDVHGLVADDREIRRGGVSYTIDTLRELRAEHPGQPLCLITGMDAFRKLNSWREWQRLIEYAHIIVVDRPGSDPRAIDAPAVAELYGRYLTNDYTRLHDAPAGLIFKSPTPMLDISSTRIRELIAAGRDIHYLLPERLITYLTRQEIYT